MYRYCDGARSSVRYNVERRVSHCVGRRAIGRWPAANPSVMENAYYHYYYYYGGESRRRRRRRPPPPAAGAEAARPRGTVLVA